jgi:hypothetical protein
MPMSAVSSTAPQPSESSARAAVVRVVTQRRALRRRPRQRPRRARRRGLPVPPGATQPCFAGDPSARGPRALRARDADLRGDRRVRRVGRLRGQRRARARDLRRRTTTATARSTRAASAAGRDARRATAARPRRAAWGCAATGCRPACRGRAGAGGVGAVHGRGAPAPDRATARQRLRRPQRRGVPVPPGQTRPCYEGPVGTANVGACRVGVQRCLQGLTHRLGLGGCEMQTLPSTEDCADRIDNDCNGRTRLRRPALRRGAGVPAVHAGRPALHPHHDPRRRALRGRPLGLDELPHPRRHHPLERPRLRGARGAPGARRVALMGLIIYPDPDGCAAPSVAAGARRAARGLGDRVVPRRARAAEHRAHADATPRSRPPSSTSAPPLAAAALRRARHRRRAQLRQGPSPRWSRRSRASARTYNVDTFVLGIPGGDLSLYPSLNVMAQAGGRARSGGVQFYEAGSTAQLESALRAITAATRELHLRRSQRDARPTRPDRG